MSSVLLIAGAGLLGGAMNALAGGGSFVTLPTLIAAGIPSVSANASSSVALYPGGIASAFVYRANLDGVGGVGVKPLLITSLIGGFFGSLLLLWTPTAVFDGVLPWLLLIATLALAFGRRIADRLQGVLRGHSGIVLAVQLVLSIYGGYFGGAAGLMLLAAWSLLDGREVKILNAPRVIMVSAFNTVAIILFAIADVVHWREAAIMAVAALVGGFTGAHLSQRLDPRIVRALTLTLACVMTLRFFWRAYGH